MATWVLTTPKGGAGKTTLALVLAGELARHRQRVEILDADPNAPILTWAARGRLPETIRVHRAESEPARLRAQVEEAGRRADFVLIDTEGTNNTLATFAIGQADLVLVPMQPSPEDARHAVRAVEFAGDIGRMRPERVPTVVVMTRTRAVQDGGQRSIQSMIAGMAKDKRLTLCPVMLAERAAYRAIVAEGCTLPQLPAFQPVAGVEEAQRNAMALLRALATCHDDIRKEEWTP